MFSINKVIVQGNAGGDPELKKLPDGRSALNLSIATGEYWKDKATGERRERTDWHRIVFYGRLAEVVAEHVKQGDTVYVEGRSQTREYTNANNDRAFVTEVIADKFKMWSKNKKDSEAEKGQQTPSAQGASIPDDDVPF